LRPEISCSLNFLDVMSKCRRVRALDGKYIKLR
jgi:hypothetical protein